MSRRSNRKQAGVTRPVGIPALAPWTPFEPALPVRPTPEKVADLARITGQPEEVVYASMMHDIVNGEWWINSRYLVIKEREPRHDGLGWVWHLSFRRLDRQPIGREHFRDCQRIKNQLLGPEACAFEIYPPESRLADTSNQYHLYAYDDLRAFPFGFSNRGVLDDGSGMVQRPLDED
jgi:hypothetical protein